MNGERENGGNPIMVVSRDNGKFRVYAANDPRRIYEVAGRLDSPTCTCPDFQGHRQTAGYHCGHIDAVLRQTANPADRSEAPEAPETSHEPNAWNDGDLIRPLQMVLKRSVSPDGRIDSLSVEFSCPVGDVTAEEVVDKAFEALDLQAAIVDGFLEQRAPNGGNGEPETSDGNGDNGPVPAQMTTIGGMQTRYGWRYFINVKVNDKVLKLFGDRKQLRECITAAGYPDKGGNIAKGVGLNLPCRVITKLSEDGRYLNIERVLPADHPVGAQGQQGQRRTQR